MEWTGGRETLARVFVAIGGLIVLALTVALVGPYFVDWTSYRADFEREASRVLGRDVKVLGTAQARLLPFPSVTFTDVTVAGIKPDETAMTIETFSMDAELAPFLSGTVLIFDMRLVRPTASIDIDGEGELSWAVRPNVPVDAENIKLEKLTVTEGKIVLRHAASGRVHQVTELNADISARALTGPWRVEGSARLDGMKTALSVSTGSLGQDGSMRLRMRAMPERYRLTLETDGEARLDDGRAHYEGGFKLFAGTPPTTNDGRTQPSPYRASGRFDVDHEALDVTEFLLETGSVDDPYTAEGNARLAFGAEPSFLVTADGAQVRFDDAAGAQAGTGFNLRQRMNSVREFLLDMPQPAIPGRIEVKLPAVVAGDTTVRDVHLSAEPSEAGWTIASLGATLPGRTTLEASGTLGIRDALDFKGSLLLAVGQPSGFAAWLSRDVDEAIRRLPAAGFSAQVELSDHRQLFRDLELVLGSARFRGEIDNRSTATDVKLDGDALDIEGMAAFASLFVSDGGETRLGDRSVSLEVAAGPVSTIGLTADRVDTSMRLKDGRLEIDRLSVTGLAGANVSATGSLSDLTGLPKGNLDATVIAPDLEPLVSLLAQRFPESKLATGMASRAQAYPGLMSDASVQLVIGSAPGGDALGLAVSASGTLGGTDFELTASTADGGTPLAATAAKAQVTARNEQASALFALVGVPALPIDFAGPAELEFSYDGTANESAQTRFAFSGEGLAARFDGAVSLDAQGVASANGKASIDSADLQPWLATAGMSLPGGALSLPARMAADLDLTNDLLVLSGVEGVVAGSTVSGDLNAQLRDGVPHFTGALALGSLDLSLLAETVVGADAIAPTADRWSEVPFSQGVSKAFTADLDLAVELLAAGDYATGSDATMGLRIADDGVFLSGLKAGLHGGNLVGHLDFRNNGGTGLLSGQLGLTQVRPADILGNLGIDGVADVTATFTANGKSIGGIVSTLAGSGTVAIERPVIAGLDPAALPAILRQADTLGPNIDAAATSVFAPGLVRRGAFEAGQAEFAFTMANGTLRVPPLLLKADGASLTADIRADLADASVAAEATMTYDAGNEAMVGSEPAVRLVAAGPLDDIGVLVDTEPLAQFLTQRALEREQQRVEAMQAALLEKQRLRREARYYAALDDARRRAAEEAARIAEEERLAAEEARRQQEEADRIAAEEAERRAAEEAARRAAEEAEGQRLEEQRRSEEQTRRETEEMERQRAAEAERLQQEERRLAEETERGRQAAEDARMRQVEAAALAQERERQRRAEDERLRAEVEDLLRNRAPALTPDTNTIAEPVHALPGEIIDVVPRPAPRGIERRDLPPPHSAAPAANAFSERNLTLDGLMRSISE